MTEYQVLGHFTGFQGIAPDIHGELLSTREQMAYLSDGNNILIRDGKMEKLRGTDYLNDVTTQLGSSGYRAVLALPIYRKYSSGDKYLIAVLPRNLYYLQNDTSWTSIGAISAGENNSVLSCCNADDKFIFTVSDDGTIKYWDGSTYDNFLASPTLKARYLLEFKTHLILFRTIESGTENYQRVWASDAGNLSSFSDINKLDLDVEGKIVGAKQWGDSIVVYLDSALYEYYWGGTALGYLYRPISNIKSKALRAPRSLCGSDDVHFYLSNEGLMRLIPGDVPRSVSDQKFNKFVLDKIDPVNYGKTVAAFFSHINLVIMAYPSSGASYNDTVIFFNTRTNELVGKKNLVEENYSGFGEYEKDLSGLSPDERKQYGMAVIPIIGTEDGYVKEQKIIGYQDGTYTYESSGTFPPTWWKDPIRNKRVLQLDAVVEKMTDSDIKLAFSIANEANENWTYQYTLTGSGNTGIRRYRLLTDDNGNSLDALGKDFRVKFADYQNPSGWKLHALFFRGYYTTEK